MEIEHCPAGRLLALDVGAKRIGVAVSDELGVVTTALTVIRHRSHAHDIRQIAELVRRERAVGVVVGLPLHMDGAESEQSRLTRRFAEKLAAQLPVPVCLWDERLSTQDAERNLQFAGRKRRRRFLQMIDAEAAAVILRDYLDHAAQAKEITRLSHA